MPPCHHTEGACGCGARVGGGRSLRCIPLCAYAIQGGAIPTGVHAIQGCVCYPHRGTCYPGGCYPHRGTCYPGVCAIPTGLHAIQGVCYPHRVACYLHRGTCYPGCVLQILLLCQVDHALNPGVHHVTWASLNLEAFVLNVTKAVADFTHFLKQVHCCLGDRPVVSMQLIFHCYL